MFEGFPGAEKIHQGVRERLPSLGLGTVDQTLWSLMDLGLIAALGPPCKTVRISFVPNAE